MLSKENRNKLIQQIKFAKVTTDVAQANNPKKKASKEDKEKWLKSNLVAIFWLTKDFKKIAFIHAVSAYDAEELLDNYFTYPADHFAIWNNLPKYDIERYGGEVGNYISLPRGRLDYDANKDKYVLRGGKWLNNSIKNMIATTTRIKEIGAQVEMSKEDEYDQIDN